MILNTSFKYVENTQTNMVKISVKEEWNMKSKLAVMGLIGCIALIIAVVLLD